MGLKDGVDVWFWGRTYMTGVLGDWRGATGICFFGDIVLGDIVFDGIVFGKIVFGCCFGGHRVLRDAQ